MKRRRGGRLPFSPATRLAAATFVARHPRGSRDRAEAVTVVAGMLDAGETTIRGWVARYEADGRRALARKVRADKGDRRAWISRAWDAAAPFDSVVKARIADDLAAHVRRQWRRRPPLSRDHIRDLATMQLMALSRAAGPWPISAAALARACRVPFHWVSRFKPRSNAR